jgi:hypothetical protein
MIPRDSEARILSRGFIDAGDRKVGSDFTLGEGFVVSPSMSDFTGDSCGKRLPLAIPDLKGVEAIVKKDYLQ